MSEALGKIKIADVNRAAILALPWNIPETCPKPGHPYRCYTSGQNLPLGDSMRVQSQLRTFIRNQDLAPGMLLKPGSLLVKISPKITTLLIVVALQFVSIVAWADNRGNGVDDMLIDSKGENSVGSSTTKDAEYKDPFGDEPRFPRWTFHGYGFNYLQLDGVGSQLDRVVRGDRDALGMVVHYSEKFDRHNSLDALLSIGEIGDLILANVLFGVKYDLAPFPKTALTPWGGLYLSLNYLDDRSNLEPGETQEEDWDGLGLGAAVAVGLSMRLGEDFVLQASVRRNRFGAIALLENLDSMADRLTTTEYSIMIVLVADMEEGDELLFE